MRSPLSHSVWGNSNAVIRQQRSHRIRRKKPHNVAVVGLARKLVVIDSGAMPSRAGDVTGGVGQPVSHCDPSLLEFGLHELFLKPKCTTDSIDASAGGRTRTSLSVLK